MLLEQLPDESGRAFNALSRYAEMGTERSLEKLRQDLGKNASYTRQLELWSAKYQWQDRVRSYDAVMAELAQKQASEEYLAQVKEHRDRYRQTGKELHALARVLLGRVATAMQNDELPPMNVATLNTLVRCIQLSGNIEAHALSLDRLLPLLDADDHDQDMVAQDEHLQ